MALLVIASAYALSYNYRYPKQDYRGALDYVMDYKAPQDIVGAVGWAATSYRFYYGPALEFPQSVADLRALQNEGRPVWVLYSFTRDMNRLWPDLYRYLREEYEPVASFRGTLPDGTVYVVRHSAANGGGASPAVGR